MQTGSVNRFCLPFLKSSTIRFEDISFNLSYSQPLEMTDRPSSCSCQDWKNYQYKERPILCSFCESKIFTLIWFELEPSSLIHRHFTISGLIFLSNDAYLQVMVNSAEKIRLAGNENIMVCERGTMFGYSKSSSASYRISFELCPSHLYFSD